MAIGLTRTVKIVIELGLAQLMIAMNYDANSGFNCGHKLRIAYTV